MFARYLMNRLPDFNQICMDIHWGMVKSRLGFGDRDLSLCLFAGYLMNRLADFNQIFMHLTLGHDNELIMFW